MKGTFCQDTGSLESPLPENETDLGFLEQFRGFCLVEGLTAASEVGRRGQTEVDEGEGERGERAS